MLCILALLGSSMRPLKVLERCFVLLACHKVAGGALQSAKISEKMDLPTFLKIANNK